MREEKASALPLLLDVRRMDENNRAYAVIGKGHETYRDREGVKTPFLERELLEEYAQQIGLE